jgi:hypothetical protein
MIYIISAKISYPLRIKYSNKRNKKVTSLIFFESLMHALTERISMTNLFTTHEV